MTVAENVLRRYEDLKGDRAVWETHWQEIAQVIAPRKGEFHGERPAGDKRMQKVYDSTGEHSNELHAAGIYGMAMNPATRWFGLRLIDDELMEREEVKEYLSDIEARIFREIYSPGAGFATSSHEVMLDWGAFGTACQFIGERDDGRPWFQTRHLRECYLGESADGTIDTLYRLFGMSARQIVQRWPDKAPARVTKAMNEDKPDQSFEVIHAIFPREERNERSRRREDLPVASVYVLRETRELIDEGGFNEFPFVVPRYYRNAGEVYGRGPGMTALPDVKMLQEMMKVHIRAGQKMVDPPLIVGDDSMLQPIRTMPGGLNFLRPNGRLEPLITNGRLDLSFEMMEDVRNRIRSTFFVDVLQFFQQSTTETATEVVQRTQERMRLLGPVLGRLEAEFLGPMIARVFGIMERNGNLPEPPEELDGVPFTVEFVSPIATAQRRGEVENLAQWLQLIGQTAQFRPEVLDRVNWDALPRWAADRFRIDPELTLDDEEAQEQAQSRQMAQAAQLAQPAKDGAQAAKTLAEAQEISQRGDGQ